jgi:hypothetical protein
MLLGIEEINPKKLFPIHTEEPEYFEKVINKSIISVPIKEKSITLEI